MSEKQREALARILAVLPYIPPSKLEYLQGYAEAMEDMSRQQAAAGKDSDKVTDKETVSV